MSEVLAFSVKKGLLMNYMGYNLPDIEMYRKVYKYLRFNTKGCYIIQKMIAYEPSIELQQGVILSDRLESPSELNFKNAVFKDKNATLDDKPKPLNDKPGELNNKPEALRANMEALMPLTFNEVKKEKDIYLRSIGDTSFVFVKCNDGVAGCGWYSKSGLQRKNEMMCSIMMYIFGFLNPYDEQMWRSCYSYLIYETGFGEPSDYDRIIIDTLREKFKK